MHPPELESLIYPENLYQEWFRNERNPDLSFRDGVNEGIMNILNFKDGNKNCTDAQAVFADAREPEEAYVADRVSYGAMHNLWNCAFYPNLTRDMRDSKLPETNHTFLLDRHIDASLVTSEKVVTFLSTCLAAYCNNSPGCKAPESPCSTSQLVLNSSMLLASSIDECLDNICNNEPEKIIDPDIVGVGAVSSYIIQFAISSIAVLGLSACVFSLRKLLRDTRPYQLEPSVVKKAARVQAIIETLLLTLDDFQRAQCCFVIAVDIASVITLQYDDRPITNQDRDAIALASNAGIAPTILILTALMALNERHSALTFWLTCFTWIFSLVVGLHPETFKGTVYGTSPSYPKACGEVSPEQVCGFKRAMGDAERFYMFLPFFNMPLLLIWQCWSTERTIYTRRRATDVSEPARSPQFDASTICVVFWVFAFCSVSFVIFFVFLGQALRGGNVSMEWTFGQIVAVAVWFPTLLSLLNDLIYGPLRGRTQQLPDTMEVVRVPMVRDEGMIPPHVEIREV